MEGSVHSVYCCSCCLLLLLLAAAVACCCLLLLLAAAAKKQRKTKLIMNVFIEFNKIPCSMEMIMLQLAAWHATQVITCILLN